MDLPFDIGEAFHNVYILPPPLFIVSYMTTSISAPGKSVAEMKVPAAIALRGNNLNQEISAVSADLARRHAQKLHDNGFPKAAKALVVKFAVASPAEPITIRSTG
jgi:hypothetical protein